MLNIDIKTEYDYNYEKGLSSREVEKRLKKYGYNELQKKKKVSPVITFLSQFNDFIIWVLLGATAISGIMGEKADAITILIIVIINAILGFVQEYRTERSLEALKELSAPTAKVIRDGKRLVVNAREIVIGDIIEVEAGDRIPADCIVVQGNNIQCDESILTGESVPVNKEVYYGKDKVSSNVYSLFMGCIITNGRGKGRVIATGMNTEMGKIADMLDNIETAQTPLQKKLEGLGKILVVGCLGICAIVTMTGILRGENAYKMFLVGVSLAVAAIPEGLPAIVTVSLALGVQRMMKKNALVRKLPAVETLGCTNVICSDKTGTLTQNKMTVKKIYIPGKLCDVSGDGYEISGEIKCDNKRIKNNDISMNRLMECCLLCNNANIPTNSKDKIGFSGDPTEIALLIMGKKYGMDRNSLLKEYRLIKEQPFDSDRKMMSVLCNNGKEKILYVKGAMESVLKNCTQILENGRIEKLSSSHYNKIVEANNKMAHSALRVLAIAYKELNMEDNDTKERNLTFIGLVGMIDPPRQEVKDSIFECKMAGITPVMITGDHKLTAQAIASELGMLDKSSLVVTGEELDKMSDKHLQSIINRIKVFARVNPSHKYRIVKAFKKRGNVVAMTGDGVNDAPAIKEADIGISMGITGTDVTKEASSMILLDDNFATIVSAVSEGRVIYDNIRKFIRYLLSCNIGEVLTMFISSLLSLPIPLIPIQILLVNLATDGLPAMALSLEPPEKDVMMRKPRGKNESIFSDGLWGKIVLRGILIGLCTVVSFSMTLVLFDGNLRLARTVALCTLVMSQLFHVFECRSERHSIFKIGVFTNMYLVAATASSLTLLLLVVYNPWLQRIFYTQQLQLIQWAIVLLFSGAISLASSLLWYRK